MLVFPKILRAYLMNNPYSNVGLLIHVDVTRHWCTIENLILIDVKEC